MCQCLHDKESQGRERINIRPSDWRGGFEGGGDWLDIKTVLNILKTIYLHRILSV